MCHDKIMSQIERLEKEVAYYNNLLKDDNVSLPLIYQEIADRLEQIEELRRIMDEPHEHERTTILDRIMEFLFGGR